MTLGGSVMLAYRVSWRYCAPLKDDTYKYLLLRTHTASITVSEQLRTHAESMTLQKHLRSHTASITL